MIQSMIAVGTGGITGRGLMDGLQKLFYLPEPHNDFIFSVIAEELGLIGATVVVACFCVITWRGLRTAMRAPDRFGAFVALGLTTMIAFQAFFNISVVLGLLPTKGIPLPFVSAGGSSLLINMIGMAVLLNVSQHASPAQVSRRVHATSRCMKPLRVVIAGGGTGGHLFPGIAVAREVLRRQPDAVVTFAGTARGIESRVDAARGFRAGSAAERRPQGDVAPGAAARSVAPAAERPGCLAHSLAALARRCDRRRRLQLGAGRARRGRAADPDAAARAERGARTRPTVCSRGSSAAPR